MKKKYLTPEMEVVRISTQAAILTISNGENLTMRTYGTAEGEDADSFWN